MKRENKISEYDIPKVLNLLRRDIGSKKKRVQFTNVDHLWYVAVKIANRSDEELAKDDQFLESMEEVGVDLKGSITQILNILILEIAQYFDTSFDTTRLDDFLQSYQEFSRKVTAPDSILERNLVNVKKAIRESQNRILILKSDKNSLSE
jgi:hypothetical protein